MLEKKNTELFGSKMFPCRLCSCWFVSKRDLAIHLQAYGADKAEHVRKLDTVHRKFDRSFRWSTMAKDAKKKP